ncbi:DUF3892 domain-containing protein [Puniceicoccales bacterium CK1056]|uniref:DUF3892 domain-containing protein n=1 Tax=Oceanipulchritudo coccoides TaxID=2706888 RepID=A0A6B2M4S7_9BACT|nr:DUF3892 domain-containing protein [Oceanipulchritudo coccoides]
MRRRVRCVKKDNDGDITHLGNQGEWWSPRSKGNVIADINGNVHSYFVKVGLAEVDIHVVDNRYLRTDPDGKGNNNLDDLPDC